MTLFQLSLAVAALSAFLPLCANASLAPAKLECEARVDPIGIEQRLPRFSWTLVSQDNNQAQSAYEIAAASSRSSLEAGNADLWRSGKVVSSQTVWIAYAGAPLHSFQDAWWRVRVWSRNGDVSTWSEPAHWRTALLAKSDRRGAWISAPERTLVAGPMPVFRREFTLDRALRQATLLISGLGFYEARLNGTKIGADVLAPGWTNYKQSICYNIFDLTSSIHTGSNALAVLLGNGTFNVIGGRYSKYTGSFGNPRLWAQLHLEFTDGTITDIASDRRWKTTNGPITYSDFYGGEDYDARLASKDWDQPGFDDAAWDKPGQADDPGGVLVADPGPGMRVQQRLPSVRITHPKPGIIIYDLGQNFSGWPHITVHGNSGDRVRLTPGELLDPQGLVTQRSSGAPMYYTYVLAGNRDEEWSPRFTYYGFRYIQVEGPPVVQKIHGEFVYLDVPATGEFSSSDQTLNRIHHLILAAMRSNLQSVLTDCPHREKLGWLEQSYLMGPSLLYDFDLRTFLPKVLRDIREAQSSDGLIPDIAPEYVTFTAGFRDSPEWGSAGVLLPWLGWQRYGDRALLAQSFPSMKAYAAYLQSKTVNGLLPFGLGDWYDIAPGPPGPSKLTPLGLTSTATYYADLLVLVNTARQLGLNGEASHFAAQADAERAAFTKAFWKTNEALYATGSQTALAMPLMTGITPEAEAPRVAANLIAAIRRNQNHTTAGDIGYRYVIEALSRFGAHDLIYDMATAPNSPSYAAQLAAGATSLTEAWDADPASSQNHLMLGHLEQWFYSGLAGIQPLYSNAGGYQRVRIEPHPVGKVHHVAASWQSLYGPIRVEWNDLPNLFDLQLQIPPGLEVEVSLPSGNRTQIAAPPGAVFLRRDGQRTFYSTGSGALRFTVKPPPDS